MLMLCLSYNYGKSGVVSPLEMKDFSRLKEEINLEPPFDNSILMMKFIEKNANFYNDDYSAFLHDEVTPPYNAIFARCIDLYKSKKLQKFVDSLPTKRQLRKTYE